MSDPNNWALGAPRHAPAVDISEPDLAPRQPLATFSDPAEKTQGWHSTGSITNTTAHRSGRRGPGGGGYLSAQPGEAGPLSGLSEAYGEILESSGLGQRPPREKTAGEEMSDADEPTQDVKVDGSGQAVHREMTPFGLRQTHIGGLGDAKPAAGYGTRAPAVTDAGIAGVVERMAL